MNQTSTTQPDSNDTRVETRGMSTLDKLCDELDYVHGMIKKLRTEYERLLTAGPAREVFESRDRRAALSNEIHELLEKEKRLKRHISAIESGDEPETYGY